MTGQLTPNLPRGTEWPALHRDALGWNSSHFQQNYLDAAAWKESSNVSANVQDSSSFNAKVLVLPDTLTVVLLFPLSLFSYLASSMTHFNVSVISSNGIFLNLFF